MGLLVAVKGLACVRSSAVERLKRSVGAGCSSHRRPRLMVSREVARQSFWLKKPMYLDVSAGRAEASGGNQPAAAAGQNGGAGEALLRDGVVVGRCAVRGHILHREGVRRVPVYSAAAN